MCSSSRTQFMREREEEGEGEERERGEERMPCVLTDGPNKGKNNCLKLDLPVLTQLVKLSQQWK